MLVFKVLDRLVPGGNSMKTVIIRSIVDPVVVLPVSLAGSFTILDCLAGKEDKFHQLKSKFLTAYTTGILFWFPVQIINFRFFPVHLRIAYVSVTSFAWSNVFCFIKNKKFDELAEVGREQKTSLA